MPAKASRTSRTPTGATSLTPKQARFVDEYLIDLNGTQAAIRAGYSAKTARVIATQNLTKPAIAVAIERAQAERAASTAVTKEYVVEAAREVLERCLERAPVMVRRGKEMVQLVDEDGAHVWQFDARGANGALTILAKHLGMFTERRELIGEGGGPVRVSVTHRIIESH